MIIYNPSDGETFTSSITLKPRHCFLMTRLGNPIPQGVENIRTALSHIATDYEYSIIDASIQVTGRDFLIKIWKLIAASPLAVGVVHEDIPPTSQSNIYYELGVAQAMGKETLIIKSPEAEIPSDFVRTEYITFNDSFERNMRRFFSQMFDMADHYETIADQLDRNPLLAIDYLKRAFLINGNPNLRAKVKAVIDGARLEERAKNSVELLSAVF